MWKDFKNYLKHKCKEMTIEDLIVRLHIEEDNKVVERRSKGILKLTKHILQKMTKTILRKKRKMNKEAITQ